MVRMGGGVLDIAGQRSALMARRRALRRALWAAAALQWKARGSTMSATGTLGILVGGGPAPGINSVISAATIEARNRGFQVLGIHEGFRWLIQRDVGHVRELAIGDVSRIHLSGGSV